MVLKRKSAHAACNDPKKTIGPKKPPTKADLQEELKMTKSNLTMTKELNDALLEEVQQNEVKIEALDNTNKLLEERVKSLEKMNPESQTKKAQTFVHTGSQTEEEDILFCQECEYPADDLYSLGEHVGEFHTEKLVEDIVCNICGDKFPSEEILKEHLSKNHRDKQPNVKCRLCEKEFLTTRDLMSHSKKHHGDNVANCWNYFAGKCDFGDEKCWFNHAKSGKPESNELK